MIFLIVSLCVLNVVSLTMLFAAREKCKHLARSKYGWCTSSKICTERGWGLIKTDRSFAIMNRRQPTKGELAQTPGYKNDG